MNNFKYKIYKGLNEDIKSIRTAVFIEEQGFKDEFDTTDNNCFHVVIYDGVKPVATCRYFKEGENYHIGRVAIVKEYRGHHLGNKIMSIAEEEISKLGGKTIEVSAQVRVKPFYNKLGYKEIGNIYYDEHCEHIRMIKEL